MPLSQEQKEKLWDLQDKKRQKLLDNETGEEMLIREEREDKEMEREMEIFEQKERDRKNGILNDINKEKEITKKYYEDNYIDKEDYKKGMPKKRCLFYKSFIEKNEKIVDLDNIIKQSKEKCNKE